MNENLVHKHPFLAVDVCTAWPCTSCLLHHTNLNFSFGVDCPPFPFLCCFPVIGLLSPCVVAERNFDQHRGDVSVSRNCPDSWLFSVVTMIKVCGCVVQWKYFSFSIQELLLDSLLVLMVYGVQSLISTCSRYDEVTEWNCAVRLQSLPVL